MRLLLDTQVALWWLVGSPRYRPTTEVPLGHKDPFDRLLLATAQAEHLVLLTGDERPFCSAYPLLLIKFRVYLTRL